MKTCKTCVHWKKNKYQTPSKEWWGTCTFIEQNNDSQSRIVVYGNKRDGEWCGVAVETKDNFGCVLRKGKRIVESEQIPEEPKPMSKIEASLKDCPVVTLTLFGENIELALTDWQIWPPSPADGVMGKDVEVTRMCWRPGSCDFITALSTFTEIPIINGLPWEAVHPAAVTALDMERGLRPKFLETIEDWLRRRREEI